MVATGARGGLVGDRAARGPETLLHRVDLVEVGPDGLLGVAVGGVAVVIPTITADRCQVVHFGQCAGRPRIVVNGAIVVVQVLVLVRRDGRHSEVLLEPGDCAHLPGPSW